MKMIVLLLVLITMNASAQKATVNAKGRSYDLSVTLDSSLKGPYTGVLRLYTQKDTSRGFGGEHSLNEPAFSINVKDWKAGERKFFDNKAHAQYLNMADVKPGYYKMIAILDTNTRERGNAAPGNLYTRKEMIMQVSDSLVKGMLILSNVFQERPFQVTDSTKEVVLLSTKLSAFRKMDVFHKAGVFLPPSYFTDPKREFPVVYVIPGWGGNHHQAAVARSRKLYGAGMGSEKIFVFLNPENQTPYGLHAYVDSRVNGPWGTALIEELMPYIQRTYRVSADPRLTFIQGQSSGGYGALWIALHFPAKIGGAWITAPDPIDFSNFTGINIYNDKNAFIDEKGKERGIYLTEGKFLSTIREGAIKESFDGEGGQQQSFEAEFGLPDKYGKPAQLYDRNGKINFRVAQSWKPYDLALYVQKHADDLKKKMIGPVKIYAGDADNFLLNDAVEAFDRKTKAFGLSIYPRIIKGGTHFNLRSDSLIREINEEMEILIRSFR
ncbi:MAG: alpha/beta hydrolase-fold protein [Chitinophagaceae bacterium]